jgi:hypothetical protein
MLRLTPAEWVGDRNDSHCPGQHRGYGAGQRRSLAPWLDWQSTDGHRRRSIR